MNSDAVNIRPFASSDINELAQLLNNKKIWDQLRDYLPHPFSEADAEEYIHAKVHQKPILTFAIESQQNKLVGNVSLKPQEDIYRHSAELGYWIGEPYWGNGFATKAIQKIVKYGFEELKLARIYATVMEGNPGSMKVLINSGVKSEGVSRNGFIKNEIYLDEHRFGILNPDFFHNQSD